MRKLCHFTRVLLQITKCEVDSAKFQHLIFELPSEWTSNCASFSNSRSWVTINLSGSLVIKRLPSRISSVKAGGNKSNAVAEVDSKTHATVKFKGSDVTSAVDENWTEQNMQRFLQ